MAGILDKAINKTWSLTLGKLGRAKKGLSKIKLWDQENGVSSFQDGRIGKRTLEMICS